MHKPGTGKDVTTLGQLLINEQQEPMDAYSPYLCLRWTMKDEKVLWAIPSNIYPHFATEVTISLFTLRLTFPFFSVSFFLFSHSWSLR